MEPLGDGLLGTDAEAGVEAVYADAAMLERAGEDRCVDLFFEVAAKTWNEVEARIASGLPIQGRVYELHYSALVRLLESAQDFGRYDPRIGILVDSADGALTIPICYRGFPWQPQDFHRLEPVGDYFCGELVNRYGAEGVGVPLVVVRYRSDGETFSQCCQAFAATALLRRSAGETGFAVELHDPLRFTEISSAGKPVSMARDLSAPLAFERWSGDRTFVGDILSRAEIADDSGLFMLEPYQFGKVPLVLVHGIRSDRHTWTNVTNELRANKALYDRYQIWVFEYPTSEPFLRSADRLRNELAQLRLTIDPRNTDPLLSEAVIVGHSMGGIIAKLLVTYSGEAIWRSGARQPLESIVTTPATRANLASMFFFDPSPGVSRVIYIGTPHRGSSIARRFFARASSALVESPAPLTEQYEQLLRDNPQAFSEEFRRRLPQSLDLLRPDSELLAAIGSLPVGAGVKQHSIIGTGRWMPTEGDSDGVVPVSSARIPWVQSESFIEASHQRLHRNVEGIRELMSILQRHLAEL